MAITEVQDQLRWAEAIANRIVDELDYDDEEDAATLYEVLAKLFALHPGDMEKLIGTSVIEEDYFD